MTMSQRLTDSVQKADRYANSIVRSIGRVLENSSNMLFIAKCCTNLQVTTPDDAALTLGHLIWNIFKKQQGIDRPRAVEQFSQKSKQDYFLAQTSMLNNSGLQPNVSDMANSYNSNFDRETESEEDPNFLNKCFIEYDHNLSIDNVVDPLRYHSQVLNAPKYSVNLDLLAARTSPNFFSSTPIEPEQFDVTDNKDPSVYYRDPFLERLFENNFDESIEVLRSQFQEMENDSVEDLSHLEQSWDSLKLSSCKDSFYSDLQSIKFSRSDCLNESQLLMDFYINESTIVQNPEKLSISPMHSCSFSGTPSESLVDEALNRLAKSLSRDPTPHYSRFSELMDTTPDSSHLELNLNASNSSTLKAVQSAEGLSESQILKDSHKENDSSFSHDINLLSDNINYPHLLNVSDGLSTDELADIALKLLSENINKEKEFYSNFEVHESDSDDSIKVLYDFCDKRTNLESLDPDYGKKTSSKNISADVIAGDLNTQCRDKGDAAIIELEADIENMSINSEDEVSNISNAKVEWINEISAKTQQYGATRLESSVSYDRKRVNLSELPPNPNNQFRKWTGSNDKFNESFSSNSSEDSVSLLQQPGNSNVGHVDDVPWNQKTADVRNKAQPLKRNYESSWISGNPERKSLNEPSDEVLLKIQIMEDGVGGQNPSNPSVTQEEEPNSSKGIVSRLKEVTDTLNLALNFNDFKW